MLMIDGVIAFGVTVLFLLALRPVAIASALVDVPGGRKRHDAVVPVIGGIAMGVGFTVATTLLGHPPAWGAAIVSVYLLIVVGTIDDRFDLPANVRLIAQACAAALVVFASGIRVTDLGAPVFFDLPLGLASAPFTLLFIITVTNAFNMIDGADGLAGGLALISLAVLAIAGSNSEIFGLTVMLIAVVGAFLIFNLPLRVNRSVRTFMGDAGSTFLGLMIATIGIWLCQRPNHPLTPVTGLWIVAVPVFDLFSAIIRRVAQHRPIFAPDRDHLHHVLVESGLSAGTTLGLILSAGALLASMGIVADRFAIPDGVMLLGWFAAGIAYFKVTRNAKAVVRAVEAVRARFEKRTESGRRYSAHRTATVASTSGQRSPLERAKDAVPHASRDCIRRDTGQGITTA